MHPLRIVRNSKWKGEHVPAGICIMVLNDAARKWLQETFKQRVLFEEPMARHTYFRVGGPADAFVKPETIKELTNLSAWLADHALPFMVIGSGSNLLVKDGGIPGVVISLQKCLQHIAVEEKPGSQVTLTAGSGVKLPALCRYAVDNGLAGLNFAIGIPGTVGGAIVMNAGTRLGCMGDVIETVTFLTAKAGPVRLKAAELNFSYRSLDSGFRMEGCGHAFPIILEADFDLARSKDRTALKQTAEQIAEERRSRQPVHSPSAGCFFKNPAAEKTAGQLIDLAGLKGRRVGDAQVSPVHANFIVNRGAATAEDILKLKDIIQETVQKQFNIRLETEVKIVGTSA